MQEAEIKQAKDKGTYDQYGIIKPRGEKITFKRKDVMATAAPQFIQLPHSLHAHIQLLHVSALVTIPVLAHVAAESAV